MVKKSSDFLHVAENITQTMQHHNETIFLTTLWRHNNVMTVFIVTSTQWLHYYIYLPFEAVDLSSSSLESTCSFSLSVSEFGKIISSFSPPVPIGGRGFFRGKRDSEALSSDRISMLSASDVTKPAWSTTRFYSFKLLKSLGTVQR